MKISKRHIGVSVTQWFNEDGLIVATVEPVRLDSYEFIRCWVANVDQLPGVSRGHGAFISEDKAIAFVEGYMASISQKPEELEPKSQAK